MEFDEACSKGAKIGGQSAKLCEYKTANWEIEGVFALKKRKQKVIFENEVYSKSSTFFSKRVMSEKSKNQAETGAGKQKPDQQIKPKKDEKQCSVPVSEPKQEEEHKISER